MVLDTTVQRRHLHADPQVITYGDVSIPLDQVEIVWYYTVRTSVTPGFGINVHSDTEWRFGIDTHSSGKRRSIVLTFTTFRKKTQQEDWTFLVNLSKRYLEPRLVAELAGQVRGGQTVVVGGALEVNLGGISTAAGVRRRADKASLPWRSISDVRLYNGKVWIYQGGAKKPAISVPMQNPNAVLIPDLFAAVTGARGAR
jgi:hypothetical protein